MVMQVVLPDFETRASFEVCGDEVNGERPLSDEEFFDFCLKNPDLRIERHSNGEIVILPPAGMETSYRNSDVSSQLGVWRRSMAAASLLIRALNSSCPVARPSRPTHHGYSRAAWHL